jgi:hypothetical protein
MKHALCGDGKDIHDYIEADQIDELICQDVEERTWRELECGWMAHVHSGQKLSDSDENTCLSFLSVPMHRD